MKNKNQQELFSLTKDIVFKSFFSRNKQELYSLLKSFLFLSDDISKITLVNPEGTDLLTRSSKLTNTSELITSSSKLTDTSELTTSSSKLTDTSELITSSSENQIDPDSINYKSSELLPDSPNDKNFILDLVVEVTKPTKHNINIEMQVIPHKGFFSRVLSYWARLHSQNLARGDKHHPIVPTHSLIFIKNSFLKKSEFPDFVNEFFIKGAKNQIVSRDLKIVSVELDKLEGDFEEVFKKEGQGHKGQRHKGQRHKGQRHKGQGDHENKGTLKKILDLQKKWGYFLRESGSLTKQERSFLLKDKDMSEAMEKLEEISKDEALQYQTLSRENSRLAYNLHMKGTREEGIQEGMQKGMQKGIQKGMQEGMQEGMQKGIQKGMQKGMQKNQLEVASTMLKKDFDTKMISEILKLPLEEIIKLEKQLKK